MVTRSATGATVLIRTMGRPSLAKAIRSVLAQEGAQGPLAVKVLVVVAGGPPLRRGDPLRPEPWDDPRVEVIDEGRPLRRAAAANRALQACGSELALFLDDDDWLLPPHLAGLLAALDADADAVAAHGGVECVRVAPTGLQPVHVYDNDITPAAMQLMNRLPIHSTLFRLSALRVEPELRFDETLDCFEDWDFWLRLMRRGRFVRVPGVTAVYRLDDDAGSGHADQQGGQRATMLGRFAQVQLQRWTADDVVAMIDHEAGQSHALTQTMQRVAGLQTELAQRHAQIDALLAEVNQLLRQQAELRSTLDELLANHRKLDAGYRDLLGSLSWRITAPLRRVRARLEPARWRAHARSAARALPLPAPLKQRLRHRLAVQGTGAGLLGWLAAPADEAATGALGTLDKEAVRANAEAELTGFLESGQRLNLQRASGQPQVSVIIVLYNQAGLSLLCLKALAESLDVSSEALIVDNASSDRMPQLLERLDGARLLPQTENLGFLRAVNLAAAQATGEHLLLLNNDAVVEPETLSRAVLRLADEPDAGAVGGPILLWDGRLQEAGSIIWRDGSCQGYGRGDSPDAPAYRYLRDVDYCSGAFLMLRRALFEQLGGFDEAFAPAYYEESDLCVRLWEAGHRIVCDPAVRVKHFEFASDAGSGQALALQARNRERFVAKHMDYLRGRPVSAPQHLLRARQVLTDGARRLLIIDDRVPLPGLGRGYPRAAMLAATIGGGTDALTYYPLQVAEAEWQEVYSVLNPRTEVMLGLGLAGLAGFMQQRAGFFDLILVSRPHNMAPVAALRAAHPAWFQGARIVYDAEALFSLRSIEQARVMGRPLSEAKAKALLDGELALARGADRVVAVSADEARQYRLAGCPEVVVLGHALVCQPSVAGFDQRSGFLFVGAITRDDCPNGDSVRWFVGQVWPLIQAELGSQVVLDVVGVCESPAVRALASPSVRILGRVDDLQPHFEQRRVFIVPTRYAAGVPHKAHEAASRGLPMVVTPLIARQLDWQDELLVASDAAAFAQACVRLHRDEAGWRRLREAALTAVARDCSPATFARAVKEIVR